MNNLSNGAIKIDKNVPMPITNRRKYPFADLAVEDSFLFPEGTTVNAAHSAAGQYARRNGVKFTVHRTPEGYRCWRIE
jgi:hypothetical protein